MNPPSRAHAIRIASFVGARRVVFFVGGVAIVYHEVVIAEAAEPLLFLGGLWLAGAPIADLLDKLRRLAQAPSEGERPPPPEVERK